MRWVYAARVVDQVVGGFFAARGRAVGLEYPRRRCVACAVERDGSSDLNAICEARVKVSQDLVNLSLREVIPRKA